MTAAAAQCVVSTAWSMVASVAAVRPGETVLVPSASGGVAGAAVQAARIAGARVIASVGSPEKVEAVRALGADVVFCYRDVAGGRGGAPRRPTGAGVDAVVDTTGGPRFAEHLAAMAADGRLVTCGAHAGEVVPLDIIELFRHGHRILGFRVATPDEIRDALLMALDGRITVPVDRTFPLSEAGGRPRVHGRAPARRQDRAGGGMTDDLLPGALPAERQLEGRRGRALLGRLSPVVGMLRERGAAIRQMPCPELAFGGTRRFWAVREQYDTARLPRALRAAGRAAGRADPGRPGSRAIASSSSASTAARRWASS